MPLSEARRLRGAEPRLQGRSNDLRDVDMSVITMTRNMLVGHRGRLAIRVLAAWFAVAIFMLPVAAQVVWSSSFESGFPGEWQNYDSGGYSPTGSMPAGRVSAWTIVGAENGVQPRHRSRMYKGW